MYYLFYLILFVIILFLPKKVRHPFLCRVFFLLFIVIWSDFLVDSMMALLKLLSFGRIVYFECTFLYIFFFTLLLENNHQNVKLWLL